MPKLLLTEKQLTYAVDGLGYNDATIDILKKVLVDGESVSSLSSLSGKDTPSRQYIHRIVSKVEANLDEKLKADKKVFVSVCVDLTRKDEISDLEDI